MLVPAFDPVVPSSDYRVDLPLTRENIEVTVQASPEATNLTITEQGEEHTLTSEVPWPSDVLAAGANELPGVVFVYLWIILNEHRAEFHHLEQAPMLADSLLSIQHRSG